MQVLLDTNVLVRLVNVADAAFAVASRAVALLHKNGDTLYVTAQNLIEFRNVATRPVAMNGLGMQLHGA